MVPKCVSLLRTQENHEKVADGLAIKISPTLSQCQTTRKLWNSRQYKKKNNNWGSKYGSLTSYENHGKVEEIGHGTNQCHFPMKIKKPVVTSQHMLEWQSLIKFISNKDVWNGQYRSWPRYWFAVFWQLFWRIWLKSNLCKNSKINELLRFVNIGRVLLV